MSELTQESWDSACDRMPQEYVDEIVRQTLPPKVDDGRPPFSGSANPSKEKLLLNRYFERQRKSTEKFLAELRVEHPELFTSQTA